MSTAPAPCLVHGIVARAAHVAVIFRRGPKKVTQILLWDLNTDEITAGQWISARVNVRDCDVTPDGRLLVTGIYEWDSRRPTYEDAWADNHSGWTTISRPPYFTALALWFDRSGLGGYWSSSRDLHLYDWMAKATPDKGALPSKIRRHLFSPARDGDPRPFEARLLRDGWEKLETARTVSLERGWREDRALREALANSGIDLATLETLSRDQLPPFVRLGTSRWQRIFPGGLLTRTERGEEETLMLLDESGDTRRAITRRRDGWTWMDLDSRGRIIYGDEGCLWSWEGFPEGKPKLVADLNANVFEPVHPPMWAREWPS